MRARIASVLAASAITSAGLLAGAHPATAAVSGGECGGGYSLVGLYKVGNQHTDRIDLHMEVYYSATAKRNCLISRHVGDAYGEVRETHARIRPSGAAWPSCNSIGCDYGDYAYYAGPVYTPAGVDMSRRCVDIAGYAGIQVDQILYNKNCG
jgi:hypothetical protein